VFTFWNGKLIRISAFKYLVRWYMLLTRHTRWRAFCSHLGTGRIEVYDAELWAIGLALWESVKKRDTLQTHRVMKVAVFSDSQATIRRTENLEPGPAQPLARWINQSARTLREAGIETEIHWVPGHPGIPGNKEADRQPNLARGPQIRHSTRASIHLGGKQDQMNLRSKDGGEGWVGGQQMQ